MKLTGNCASSKNPIILIALVNAINIQPLSGFFYSSLFFFTFAT